jgi:hypothetical protein
LAYSSQKIASYRIPMVEKATGFIEINIWNDTLRFNVHLNPTHR